MQWPQVGQFSSPASLLAIVTLPVGPAAFAALQAPGGLVIPVPSGDVATGSEPALLRGRLVDINFGLLVSAHGAPGMADGKGLALRLDLFENASFTAILDEATQNSPLSYSWVGRLDGVDFSQVILVVEQGIMAGHIAMPGAVYQIRYAGNGGHVVYEIDQSAFPPEASPVEIDASTFDPPAESGDAAADNGSQIDVLVVYTPAARAAAGGTTGMNTQVDLAIAVSNTSYANSGITPRLRLVHKEEVSYTESGDLFLDLPRLTDTSDGYMDVVHSLRDTYQADLVALIVENGGAFCGLGYVMTSVSSSFASSAFSVTVLGCTSANHSFPHELGHNQGAHHDRYAPPPNNGAYTYSHGYVNTSAHWRTVMAYDDQCTALGFNCTRLQYWSNPDVSYGGAPMGVPEGQADAADNRKTLNNTAYTVANFRQSGTCDPAQVGTNQLLGCVYDNTALAGAPQTTAPAGPTLASPVPSSATALAINWGLGGPSGTAPDTFSIRWRGTFTFSAGTYAFTVGADDGVRLKIDGITQIDDWSDHGYREPVQSVTLGGGTHLIEVEYYEQGGDARVELRWQGGGGDLPDLLVTALSGPTTGTIGGQITVSLTLRNQGTVSAGAFRVGYYWSQNATITTGDVFSGWICTFSSGLGAGATGTCSGPVGVPSSLTPGVWYLGAIVDDQGVVSESDEGNNARAADTGPITLGR